MDKLPTPWVRTPLVESAELSRAAGCRVFLKFENLQPSGSFKLRGMGNLIRRKVIEAQGKPLHFFCSSGGNAGLAAATAAHALGQKCTVVVPSLTTAFMMAKIRAAGAADVIQMGNVWAEADAYLRETFMAREPGAVYVPPFEHEDVYDGNATLVTEVSEVMAPGTADEPDAFVCSVGGGGLFSGVAQGVEKLYGGRPTVVAVETVGCDSLYQSLEAGERITLPRISSLAISLGASRVGARTFEWAQHKNVASTTVTDAEAAMGCWRFADDERMIVEMACGASTCLAYNGKLKDVVPNFSAKSKVVIIVCGGASVSLETLAGYREKFGPEVGKFTTSDRLVSSTHTAPNGVS